MSWLSSLDPLLKALAQRGADGMVLFPQNKMGWFFFISGFIFGFIAFAVTQWAFHREIPSSRLIPVHNSVCY